MRSIQALVLLLPLLLAIPVFAADLPTAKPGEVGLSAERLERLGQALRADVEKGRIPGAVVVIARRGRVAFVQVAGFRDPAARAPMTPDAIFRIVTTLGAPSATARADPAVPVAALILARGAARLISPERHVPLGSPDDRVLVRLQVLTAHRRCPGGHRVVDGGLDTAQLLHHGEAAERHVHRRVASLVAQDQPASAELIRGRHERSRHRAEGLAVRHHPPERVVDAAVEARGHDDQLRPERAERRNDDSLEGREVGAMT